MSDDTGRAIHEIRNATEVRLILKPYGVEVWSRMRERTWLLLGVDYKLGQDDTKSWANLDARPIFLSCMESLHALNTLAGSELKALADHWR